MSMFYIKLTRLKDFHLEEVPVSSTGQFTQGLDSFYARNSHLSVTFHLSVTNIAQMAMFYLY